MPHRRHEIHAVVTDMNVNGLAVARVLGRHGVPVVGIGEDRDQPEMRSRYLDEHWLRGEDLLARLVHEGQRFQHPPVLFAITDESVELVCKHYEDLSALYHIAFSPAAAVGEMLDKQHFDRVARELGLPLPRTCEIGDAAQLEQALAEIPPPWIMKPVHKSAAYLAAGGQRAYQGAEPELFRSAFAGLGEAAPRMVLQEFIPGGDDAVHFCLLARGKDNQNLAACTGRKLRQWRPGTGGTSAAELVEAPELVELSERFFAAQRITGLCSMEFKRDAREGTFSCIEPTVGRSDWQNGLADANGLPLPYLVYLDCLGEPQPKPSRPWLRRRWVHWSSDRLSAHHHRRQGDLGRASWLWSLRPPIRGAYFAVDDLGPYLARLAGWFRTRRRSAPTGPSRP